MTACEIAQTWVCSHGDQQSICRGGGPPSEPTQELAQDEGCQQAEAKCEKVLSPKKREKFLTTFHGISSRAGWREVSLAVPGPSLERC